MSRRFALVNKKNCVACGACTKECPRQVISIYKGCYALVDEMQCVGCGKCEKVCPAGCMIIKERDSNEK